MSPTKEARLATSQGGAAATKMGIRMELASGRTCRLIAGILLVLADGLGGVCAQTYTNLYSFSGPDGRIVSAGLLQGGDGNFYGTTYLRRDARGRHCVSDQPHRQLHESLLIWQLPQRWTGSNSHTGAGQ
jgi:hypothetical protein